MDNINQINPIEKNKENIIEKSKENLIEESYKRLYPDRAFNYQTHISYTAKFKPYNANIRYSQSKIKLNLCKKWKNINNEITIGLIQSLLVKLWKSKKTTTNIDLYNSFVKNIHIAIPKKDLDPMLEESFNRVNQTYQNNTIETPNLKWGNLNLTKLGTYEFKSDVITISTALKDAKQEILDYVVYHELLHKKFKFTSHPQKTTYHSKEFKLEEKSFKDSETLEKELNTHLLSLRRTNKSNKRKRSLLSFFFH